MTREMMGYGVELSLTDGALREVARRGAAEGTGARGLVTVLEGILRPFKFELPSTDVRELIVDEAVVAAPEAALAALLADFEPRRPALVASQVERFAERAARDAGFARVELAPCARDELVGRALAEGRCARELCVTRLEPAVEAAAAALSAAAGDGDAARDLRVTAAMLAAPDGS